MLVYAGTKQAFNDDIRDDLIAEKINSAIIAKTGRCPSKSEYRSWSNSLEKMFIVLNDGGIPNECGVAIEYNIPLTAKRIDFILSGYDDTGRGTASIIELKQWEEVEAVPCQEGIVETYVGGAKRHVTHPSYQAWSYAEVLRDYNESVQNNDIALWPCAYLHNYKITAEDPLLAPQYSKRIEQAPIFAFKEVRKLQEHLKSHIATGDSQAVLEQIDHGKLKPSKSLQDALGRMLEGNAEFVLLDDQKVVFEKALHLAQKAVEEKKKTVLIVEGGPGTGKSVVAINLLVELTKRGMTAQYVSKNSAPRNVYSAKLKGRQPKKCIDSLFRGSGSFVDAVENSLDAIIADEAHRLNEKSGLFGNLGDNQILEIMKSAWFSVFFLDENQRVTLQDIGSKGEIKKWADTASAELHMEALSSQFRCNGSDGYLAWVDDVLDIRETANPTLEGIDYAFVVFDSPEEMEKAIRERNDVNKARILAGYCWEWPKKTRADSGFHDIEVDSWSISWNLDNSSTYAIDKDSINEAGCIHTVQGLEFDYVAVIIGEDMRYENGVIVSDFTKRAKSDQSLRGIKKLAKNDSEKADKLADEIIKNTYRILMTRGMKGCYVYCVDEGLREYLRERAKPRFEYGTVSV